MSAWKNVLISLPLRLHFCYSSDSVLVNFQFGEVVMTFTKALIAKKMADDCGFMKGEAVEIFEKLLEIMKARLADGEDVMMSGFGKWSVKSKNARRGRNPQTGDQLVLDARRVVTWKYSPVLKKACNELRLSR
jgi:integration host factor subunit alpha